MCVYACKRVCFCACVRSRHSSSGNLRRCDLRDTGFCSFWGLRGAEVLEFQFPPNSHSQSHTLTLHISGTNTLLLKFCLFPPLCFTFNHCLSFSCNFIHKVQQGEVSSNHFPVPPPFSSSSFYKPSCFFFTWSSQAEWKQGKKVKVGAREGRVLRIAGPSHFPEMLQPIPKLRANESGLFTTQALPLQ